MKLMLIKSLISIAACLGLATASGAPSLQDFSRELVELVSGASPAVVEIQTTGRAAQGIIPFEGRLNEGDNVFSFHIGRRIGSGFVIDSDGYILTTSTVVGDSDKITVKFSDGSESEAKLMGVDPLSQAAVIKVEKSGLTALPLGDSDSLKPGAIVVMINNQSGMTNSTSLGIVAGTGRQLGGGGSELIQISGTIGPGASGGPVLDASGKVVGVTTAMFSPTSEALPFNLPRIYVSPDRPGLENLPEDIKKMLESNAPIMPEGVMESDHPDIVKRIELKDIDIKPLDDITSRIAIETSRTVSSSGFAIPINEIKAVLDELKSGKSTERGWLGVHVSKQDGKIVLDPVEGGPADKAGVEKGDVLIKADNRTFDDIGQFVRYVSSKKTGETLSLVLDRDGKEVKLDVRLDERPSSSEVLSITPDEAMSRLSIGIQKALGEPDRVALDIENAAIEQVAKALSTAFDVNVIVTDPERITKKATIHMSNANVEDALDAICRAMDCTYKKDGDTYVITPR